MAEAPKKPRKKAVNGYKMPEPIPKGEILTDIAKNNWRVGASIGKGGFGEIYTAQDAKTTSSKYPYVVKVEPHGNGPLFVEMHFYMKNAKAKDIEAFMDKHKLKTFGMPVYLGSGSHEHGPNKYRFIVMEKFGSDVDKLRGERKGVLNVVTVFQLAWQIAYVLEYIHELGYVHADIKGGNVLLGATNANKNQVYLLDFGLATKFTTDKEFKPNPKKAHDGTIEYLSRDAHQGVPTRRGDFEVLGYNLIHWLGGTLPWESKLTDPKLVQQLKEEAMTDIPKFIKSSLKKYPETLIKFLQYVNKLKFNEKPDYKKIRALFEQEVEKNGSSVDAPFDFNNVRKRRSVSDEDKEQKTEDVDVVVKKRGKPLRKKEKENVETNGNAEAMTDAMKEVLARKREKDLEKEKGKNGKKEKKKQTTKDLEEPSEVAEEAHMKKKTSSKKDNGQLEGYNEEMKEVRMRMMNKAEGRPRRNVPVRNYSEKE